MSYRINKTDGTILVDLIDGTIDTSASDITLIGRNYKGFGELINENFVKMLENFASSSAPANPLRGQLWYDTSENRLKVYNGTAFSTNGIIVANTQPNLATGDIWINSLTNQMSFFDGTDLVLVGPTYTAAQGVSGFESQTILSTLSQNKTVLKFSVQNTLIGVWSASQFTPTSTQVISELITAGNPTGTIYPGFNLTSNNYKYRGVATLAEGLIDGSTTILAAQFLRSDTNDSTQGTLKINTNPGVANAFTIGANDNLQFDIASNQNFTISLNNGSLLKLRVKDASNASRDVITIQGGLTPSQLLTIGTNTDGQRVNTIINGDLTVNGSTTNLNSTNLVIEDKNIILADVTTPTDITADGGGITLKGATDKTLIWDNGTDSWTSSEHIDLATGKEYKINGTTVLSSTTLGSTVTSAPGLVTLAPLLTGPLNVDQLRLQGVTLSTPASGNLQLQSATNIISIQGSARITGLGLPSAATDATRKDYVDGYAPITITLDITGLNATGNLNTNIATILTDLYPPTTVLINAAGLAPAAGFIGIPASAEGRVATVYTLESSSLVNIPGANLNAALMFGTAQVDQTLSGVSVLATTVQTLAGVGVAVNLDPGHIRITTASAHQLEVGQTVSISGSAGIIFDGTYTVAQVTSNTAFDIDVSALIPGIDTVSGGTYTPNSATVLRAATIGNFNKIVLQDVSFGTVAVSGTGTVTRGLKRFKVQGGVWVFHANYTPGTIV